MTRRISFDPVTNGIRRICFGPDGRLLEVTHLYDIFAKDTNDPALAANCVIEGPYGAVWPASCEDVSIYTVH